MSWLNQARRESIYNRLHKGSVYALIGLTLFSGIILVQSAYHSIVARKQKKEEFAEGELPAKSD